MRDIGGRLAGVGTRGGGSRGWLVGVVGGGGARRPYGTPYDLGPCTSLPLWRDVQGRRVEWEGGGALGAPEGSQAVRWRRRRKDTATAAAATARRMPVSTRCRGQKWERGW
ncbi:hypothetical protein GCM10010350_44660 [Streptomyces galilaeus]|nr:hypothetical protein GCM10010350_44660 [Streptomyces galilaeus]